VNDAAKTREELIAEVEQLRRRVADLQASGAAAAPKTPADNGRLLGTIMDNVPIIVFAVDRNGIITLSEGKSLHLLGLKPGEHVGQSAIDVFNRLPEIEQKLNRALAGESISTTVEVNDVVFEFWHTPLVGQAGETIGVAGIALDVTERKRAVEQLRAQQRLMQQMLRSHEQDRRLTAYELHDGLVQDATGAQMQLEALLQTDQLAPGQVREQVQLAAELVRNSVREARQLISGLRPPILDELGVVPAIEYLLEDRQAGGPSVELTTEVQFDRLEPLLEATIYRIVQEAFGNVVRHSRSDRAEIRLTQVEDRIHVEIQDWGIGFDPAGVHENRFGLQGIRERARLLRGQAVIDSAPGKGTRVFVDLPVAYALEEVESANSWSNP